jgi:hypothetical protein
MRKILNIRSIITTLAVVVAYSKLQIEMQQSADIKVKFWISSHKNKTKDGKILFWI